MDPSIESFSYLVQVLLHDILAKKYVCILKLVLFDNHCQNDLSLWGNITKKDWLAITIQQKNYCSQQSQFN